MNKEYEKTHIIIKNEKYYLIQFSFAKIKDKKKFPITSNTRLIKLLI